MGRAHGDRPDAESVARSTRLVVRDVHLRAHATCATLHAMLSSVLSLALAATAPGDATTTPQREAAAPHEAIRFRWQAPANCPEEPAVRAAIEQRLGGPLAGRTAPRITIIVDVRQQPDHQYGVNVWTVDDDGLHQRQLALAGVGAARPRGVAVCWRRCRPYAVTPVLLFSHWPHRRYTRAW